MRIVASTLATSFILKCTFVPHLKAVGSGMVTLVKTCVAYTSMIKVSESFVSLS